MLVWAQVAAVWTALEQLAGLSRQFLVDADTRHACHVLNTSALGKTSLSTV